jgi:cysteine desulfurase
MIYLDNAATTAVHPAVFSAMRPYLEQHHGNPSSVHGAGRTARSAIQKAREQMARSLGAKESQLVFTSGGTEANHAALFGAFLGGIHEGRKHFVSTTIEHPAVLQSLQFLKTLGAEVTLVPVSTNGLVQEEALVAAVREDTACVSVMAVNNEIGTIQPIDHLAALVKKKNSTLLFHSDMVQALSFQHIHLNHREIDMASFSSHKIHGPKGMGLLYLKQAQGWRPTVYGGSQEHKRRAGTENVPGIVGFGAAMAERALHFEAQVAELHLIKSTFATRLSMIPQVEIVSPRDAAPTILSVRFMGIRNETMLMRLDMEGIAASAGSACTAGSTVPSHVLQACGLPEQNMKEIIRFSFSADNSISEIHAAADIVHKIVATLRQSRGKSGEQ